jgi:peroxiredoxin Q/BCP
MKRSLSLRSITLLNLLIIGVALFAPLNCFSLSVGETVPAITAPNQDGKLVAFKEVFSRGTTLVYFYPKAETPGCTAEACSLRDDWGILRDASGKQIQILGVSKDSPEAQKRFQQKHHLPFDLIADVDGKVAHVFGVPLIPVIGVFQRQSFLVKGDKVVWSSSSAQTAGAAKEVQQALDKANSL